MIVVRVAAGIIAVLVYSVLAFFVLVILATMAKVALGW